MQVLAYQSDGTLLTGDQPEPVPLGKMPADIVARFGDKMQPGLLLRFSIGARGFYLGDGGSISGADLQWEGVANQKRGGADRYSKIVFQWQLRSGRVTFDALLAAASRNVDASAIAPLPISDSDQVLMDSSMDVIS